MRIKLDINIKIGRIVKYLILVNLLFFAGWGLIEPIFAVFIVDNVAGATVVTVGIFAAIYWILKSVLQLPIARYLDKTPGEKDDFYALIFGLFLASISAFMFVLVHETWQLYAVQVLHSLAIALYIASWPALFSRHLDQDKVSFDWALDSSAIGLSAGFGGFFGGVIAQAFGFETVFLLVAFFSAASAMFLLLVPDLVFPKIKKEAEVPPTVKIRPPSAMGH
ncbi:MAG: MFS transporter [Candidatus Liptonbacteria bacterium]|nr:MFS transporter [Candidatus Liptonbacteria bacterium]